MQVWFEYQVAKAGRDFSEESSEFIFCVVLLLNKAIESLEDMELINKQNAPPDQQQTYRD